MKNLKILFSFDLIGARQFPFPGKGTSDYVISGGMPRLNAMTVCLWMKTTASNEGVLLSYAVSGQDNELLLHDYRDFLVWVGGSNR